MSVVRSKNTTRKYRVSYSNAYGRYLVAGKDLDAGEIILGEKPLVVGPISTENVDLCFACMRAIFKTRESVTCVCSKCEVAFLCSQSCHGVGLGSRTNFHSDEECELLKSKKDLIGSDDASSVAGILSHLRLWLLWKNDAILRDRIDEMESHVTERRNTKVWEDVKNHVINPFGRLHLIDDSESDELSIQKIGGILDVNTFELRSPENCGTSVCLLRGLYSEASLMAHKCVGNTHLTVDDEFLLTIYASVPIRENEPIYFNYTSPLMGFAERRAHLMEGKYFFCRCSVCQDPSESGSHLSAILCTKCKKDYVLPTQEAAQLPYSKAAKWRCRSCEKVYRGCLIKLTLDIVQGLIDRTEEDDTTKMEALLEKLLRSLHTNHSLVLIVKQKLLAAYRREVDVKYVGKKSLERMLELCREVMGVIDIMEPGISRLKGILSYEMHFPLVILANRAYTLREISAEDLISKLEEGRKLVKLALNVLLLESPMSSEGLLAKEALQEFKTLNQSIADVKSLPAVSSQRSRRF